MFMAKDFDSYRSRNKLYEVHGMKIWMNELSQKNHDLHTESCGLVRWLHRLINKVSISLLYAF